MQSSRDFLERLTAADRSLGEERMPRASARRIAKRISAELEAQARPSRVGWIPMLTFVAGAALVMLFLRWSTEDDAPTPAGDGAQPVTAVLVSGPDCRSQSDQTTEVWGACSLSAANPAMEIDTIEASHLEVDGRVVHLRTGSALFDVDKVHGEPVRIATPHGEIVVVGTRFRVVVDEGSSQVDLYEGRLEFHDPSGVVTPINAGQHVEFGRPEAKAPAPVPAAAVEAQPATPAIEPPAPAPRHAQPDPPAPRQHREVPTPRPPKTQAPVERDAGPVIESAEKLRREGRYADAAATLRAALKRRWPKRTAEVLSYELGRLLARRVRDHASACAHWRDHLRRFSGTRYRTQIERSLGKLECE